MLLPKTGGQFAGLAVPPCLHKCFTLDPFWSRTTQREARGAQGSRCARGAQGEPLEGESILPAALRGVVKVSPHLWVSSISLESVRGGQGKELVLSCNFCPHLPHLIHSFRRNEILCFLRPSLSVSLAVPFHLIRAALKGNTLSQRELEVK